MNAKSEKVKTDFWGWIVILLLAAVAVAINFYLDLQSTIRLIVNLAALFAILVAASFTKQGRKLWLFMRESRIELRKVVWPSRQETIHTTLLVIAVVIVAALFLWGIDSLLFWLVSILTT